MENPLVDAETYSDDETAARMEAGLRRALATPHKRQEKIGQRPERPTFARKAAQPD
jgi:hypothetical protein